MRKRLCFVPREQLVHALPAPGRFRNSSWKALEKGAAKSQFAAQRANASDLRPSHRNPQDRDVGNCATVSTANDLQETSDHFFAETAETALAGRVDFAFIDGLLWSEFVLRDFINI